MAKRQRAEREITIADAISEGVADLVGLGEEMREWADNMEDKFSATQKYETVSDTAGELENISEPDDYPEFAKNTRVKITDLLVRRRPYSRADRCGQACYVLGVCVDALRDRVSELEEEASKQVNGSDTQEEHDACSELADEIERHKDNAEALEFPGMYG